MTFILNLVFCGKSAQEQSGLKPRDSVTCKFLDFDFCVRKLMAFLLTVFLLCARL